MCNDTTPPKAQPPASKLVHGQAKATPVKYDNIASTLKRQTLAQRHPSRDGDDMTRSAGSAIREIPSHRIVVGKASVLHCGGVNHLAPPSPRVRPPLLPPSPEGRHVPP